MSTTSPEAVNYWPDNKCARAFWGQQELPPYRRLLRDTTAWIAPQAGERWLDLGCGSGQLSKALWEKSGGNIGAVVGVDCAAINAKKYERLRGSLQPPADAERLQFIVADFSTGLSAWEDGYFDGVVSGLSIQYAEAYSEAKGCWTSSAYDRLLGEVQRLLRPGGPFVFSVNVPEPAWGKVALYSLPGVLRSRRPGRFLKNALRMMSYGGWLTREARRGRFHYLPLATIQEKLAAQGFTDIEHQLSYAGQAYLIRCRAA